MHLPARLDSGLPPRISWSLLASGKVPLVYHALGSYERPALSHAFAGLLKNLHNVQSWIDLISYAGTVADVFVYDRHGERYRVIDVIEDPGGETGELILRHLGKKSRKGDLRVDIHEAYGYMIPVLVYKPTRQPAGEIKDDTYKGHDEAKKKWFEEAQETWNKKEKLPLEELEEMWVWEWSRRKHAEKFGGRSIGETRNPRKNPKYPPVDWRNLPLIIQELENTTQTIPQLAKKYGLKLKTLETKIKKTHPHFLGRGAGGKSKITQEDWIQIEAAIARGLTIPRIAELIKKPYSTLVGNLKTRGIYEKAARKKTPKEKYKQAVALLKADKSLSIARAAKKLKLDYDGLKDFLKASRETSRLDFASRFRNRKGSGKGRIKKVVEVGDILRNIINDDLFIAAGPRIMLGMKNGKMYEKLPTGRHVVEKDFTMEDVVKNWGVPSNVIDLVMRKYLERPTKELKEPARGNKYDPHEYRVRW